MRGTERTGMWTKNQLPRFWNFPTPQSEQHSAGSLECSLQKFKDLQSLIIDKDFGNTKK